MSRTARPLFLLRLTFSLLIPLLCLTGCSHSAQNLDLDEDEARLACETFLKAWQDGATSKSLEPDLVGTDEAWSAGMKLVSFEVLPDETNDGTNLHIPVRLKIADASGKESEADVTYCVGTSPRVTVFRD